VISSLQQFVMLCPYFHKIVISEKYYDFQDELIERKSHSKSQTTSPFAGESHRTKKLSKVVPEESLSVSLHSSPGNDDDTPPPVSRALETPWLKAVTILNKLIEESPDARTLRRLQRVKHVMMHPETMNSISSLKRLSLNSDTAQWFSSTLSKTPIKEQQKSTRASNHWGNVKANINKIRSLAESTSPIKNPIVVFNNCVCKPKLDEDCSFSKSFKPKTEHMRRQQEAADRIKHSISVTGSPLALASLNKFDPGVEGLSPFKRKSENQLIVPPFPMFTALEMATVEEYLQENSFTSWDFDIVDFDSNIAQGHSLWFIGMILCHYYNFVGLFQIDPKKLSALLVKAEKTYCFDPQNPNIYHNHRHAADVALTCFHYCNNKELSESFEALDGFALLLAAIFHDYRHPGFNNGFMVKTRDDIAVTYNDSSVLENFHAAEAYRLFLEHEYNILQHLKPEVSNMFRMIFIKAILATDLACGFEYVSRFKNAITINDFQSESGKLLLVQMALKCADVAHPSKSWDLHQKWSKLISDEFFLQGDVERTKHLPLSPLCDRHSNSNFAKSQCDFIDFVVRPSLVPFSQYCKEILWISKVDENYKRWQGIQEQSVTSLLSTTDLST